MIFSTKSLIWTLALALVGFMIYKLFKMISLDKVGLVILVLFALVGFVIGTCKMPKIESVKLTAHTAGENLDDIIKRAVKFKLKKNKIYIYAKEEEPNDIK